MQGSEGEVEVWRVGDGHNKREMDWEDIFLGSDDQWSEWRGTRNNAHVNAPESM